MRNGIAMCLALLLACLLAPGTRPAHAQDQAARRQRAERLHAIGRGYLAAGDPGSAAGYFRDAIRVDPDYADAYLSLGTVYIRRGSLGDALEVLRTGLSRQPHHGALWRALAEVHERRGELDQAAEALRTLLRQDPEDVEGHLARADLGRRRGAWSEALASYRAVIDLAARGHPVPADRLEEARRYAAALARLTGSLDPVTAVECDPATVSEVRRALAGCP